MNYPPNSFMPPQMGQMQPQMGQMPQQQQQPMGQFPPNMMGDQHQTGQFPPLGGQMPQTPPILQQQPMLGQNMVPQHQDGSGRQWAMDHMQQFMGQHQMGWPQALGMLGGYGLRSLLHRGQ